ncbi:MAG: HigA family addiction module antidote protein [Bacteroidetes bacterium]|nr:HigA family addiction module antidote protein [Bacteroidota bacterium]
MNNMRPIHPGEIIKEEYLKPLSMSVNALAVALRVPASRINDVVRQKRGVSIDTALRLARYFNTTSQFWMNLQISYDLKIATQNMEKIEKEIIPLQIATA